MITTILQAVCISVAVIALGFIFLELKTNFEKSFLYFGITILLLCLFSSIDLWVLSNSFSLQWLKVQHFIFCFIPPCLLWYLYLFTKKKNLNTVKNYFIVAFILSIFTLWGIPFKENKPFALYLYYAIYPPYILFSITFIIVFIAQETKNKTGSEKKILRYHLFGLTTLAITGLLDLFDLLGFLPKEIRFVFSSYTMLGIIALCFVLTYVFTEYFILLVKERKESLAKLQLAYEELDSARSLSELGKSTAIINHEIRNYTFSIMCGVELIKEHIKDQPKPSAIAERVINTIQDLHEFSEDILDFSRAKIIREKSPICINHRILKTIQDHFSNRQDAFTLKGLDNTRTIHGDWVRLDLVFINLFRNAFEAGATGVTVKLIPGDSVTLISIEDDGKGYAGENPNELFKAFFTTKGRQGTGLGLSITRAIVESHGGQISIVSKNASTPGAHGLVFSIAFPAYGETKRTGIDEKDDIVLIKKNLEQLQTIIQVFRNVCVNPHILQDLHDFVPDRFTPCETVVLGNPDIIGKINERYNQFPCYSIVNSNLNGLYVVGNRENAYTGIFCEEFVLSSLKTSRAAEQREKHPDLPQRHRDTERIINKL